MKTLFNCILITIGALIVIVPMLFTANFIFLHKEIKIYAPIVISEGRTIVGTMFLKKSHFPEGKEIKSVTLDGVTFTIPETEEVTKTKKE